MAAFKSKLYVSQTIVKKNGSTSSFSSTSTGTGNSYKKSLDASYRNTELTTSSICCQDHRKSGYSHPSRRTRRHHLKICGQHCA